MNLHTDLNARLPRRRVVLGCIMLIGLLHSGCDVASLSHLLTGLTANALSGVPSTIEASVSTTSSGTGLPETLTGTLSGLYQGTYDEIILEIYVDSNGSPVAGLSRSLFTITSPFQGTLTSLNLVVVMDIIVATDANGNPLLDANGNPTPIGLESSASGEIIEGTGAFAGMTGHLNTSTTLSFIGGSAGLGNISSDLSVSFRP